MNNAPSSREDLDERSERNTWELLSVMVKRGALDAVTPTELTYLLRLEDQGFVRRNFESQGADQWILTEEGRRYSNQAEPPFRVALDKASDH